MKRGPTGVWLIKSGETAWDADDRLYGGEDLPITEAGRSATEESADRVVTFEQKHPRVIYHAPDEAAEVTAEIIAKRISAKTRPIQEFSEPDLGVLTGLSIDELRERFERRARQWEGDPTELVPPEGESFLLARRRVVTAFAKVLKKSKDEVIGCVMHDFAGGFLRATLAEAPSGNPRLWMAGRPRIEMWALPEDAHDRLQELILQMPME